MEGFLKNAQEVMENNGELKESCLKERKIYEEKLRKIDDKIKLFDDIKVSIFLIKVLFNYNILIGEESKESIFRHYCNTISLVKKISEKNYNFTQEELHKCNELVMGDMNDME